MEQGVVDPLVSYPSIGEEGDGMNLVTGRSKNALCVQGSGRLFPVHVHAGSEGSRSKENSLGVILLGPCMERDFNVLRWSRGRELERYVELLLLLWDVDFLPVEFVITAVACD
jgi:hypothetical protein